MSETFDRLNAALEGRYHIEHELGVGGMATVYLARDLKHDRSVAIKVLKPGLTVTLGAERFLKEISIAARFSHPHILPLHDSGEVDGSLYYVMPYVEGESLRDRLVREKQLPLEDALEIARQVAEALSYAHAHDVVHRDIKPENILLSSGQAVVADFGVARAISLVGDAGITGTGLTMGTPNYMSPEQASGSLEIDGRVDVYALGCVLYEMLTGEPPYLGPSAQVVMARQLSEPVPRITQVRATVPAAVEQIVTRCLAKTPADRFATAAQLGDHLRRALRGEGSGSLTHVMAARIPRSRWLQALAAVVAVVAMAGIYTVVSADGLGFEERDWILIADLENQTGEDVFDRSLHTGLTVALSQSRYVNVFPRNRLFEALSRMERDSVESIHEQLALEIAVRENIRAVVVPSITNIDTTFLLTTRLIDPASGAAIAAYDAQAPGKHAVLDALDDLARRLRRELGESLAAIEANATPLPLATTPSLEALKLYADGSVQWSASQWEEARTLWEQAVALDSNFAWVHASLGLAAGWLNGPDSAQAHYQKALSLLDRVTERERLWITSLATDGEESVRALRLYLQQYPDDRDAWYNLGNGLRRQRLHGEALDAYGRSLEIDSMATWAHVNSAMVYDEVGRFQESAASFESAFAQDPGGETRAQGDLNRISGFVLAKLGDTASARERFEKMLTASTGQQANGHRSLGLLEMYAGRYRAGITHLREAVLLTQTDNALLSEYRNRLYLATAYRAKGMTAEVTRELAEAERLVREMGFVGTVWLLNLGEHYAALGRVDESRRILDTIASRDQSDDFNRSAVEYMRGLIALASNDPAGALESLELSHRISPSDQRLDAIGRAALETGDLDRAESAFLEIQRHMGLGWEAQEPWAHSHYHLGLVYEGRGEPEQALDYYQRLMDLWAEGDDDLVALAETRAGIARVLGEPTDER